MEKFIHLRVQSSYSLLSSTLTVKKIANLAKSYSMPAIEQITIMDLLF